MDSDIYQIASYLLWTYFLGECLPILSQSYPYHLLFFFVQRLGSCTVKRRVSFPLLALYQRTSDITGLLAVTLRCMTKILSAVANPSFVGPDGEDGVVVASGGYDAFFRVELLQQLRD